MRLACATRLLGHDRRLLFGQKSLPGVGPALLAALLFGPSTPLAKLLVTSVSPVLFAGLFYGGSMSQGHPGHEQHKASERCLRNRQSANPVRYFREVIDCIQGTKRADPLVRSPRQHCRQPARSCAIGSNAANEPTPAAPSGSVASQKTPCPTLLARQWKRSDRFRWLFGNGLKRQLSMPQLGGPTGGAKPFAAA